MPTTHLLLPSHRWDSLYKGEWFQVGDRQHWDITLTLSRLSAGGSFQVVVETMPDGGMENDWTTLVDFTSLVATSVVVKKSYNNPTVPDFSIVVNKDMLMRARVAAVSGVALAELRAVAPFFDVSNTDHLEFISKEAREWSDGIDELASRSEEEVINLVMGDVSTGELDVNLLLPGASDAVPREIARQIEHNKQRTVLERTADPSALVTLRGMGTLAPGIETRLRKYRYNGRGVWLGR